MWKAAKKVFCGAKRIECSFHWCQAVFRRIKLLGVRSLYRASSPTDKECRKLLNLNLLPENDIPKVFAKIERNATGLFKDLCNYIKKQWIISSRFPPSSWSVYRQPIRTNNDAEGWHNRFNQKAGIRANLQMYELLSVVYEEADLVKLHMTLLNQVKLIVYKKY